MPTQWSIAAVGAPGAQSFAAALIVGSVLTGMPGTVRAMTGGVNVIPEATASKDR